MQEGADKNAIGRFFRDARKKRGFTQTQLAKQIGCTHPVIVAIENGGSYSLEKLLDGMMALGLHDYCNQMRGSLKSGGGLVAEPSATSFANASPALPISGARCVPVVSYATAGQANDYEDLANFFDETIQTDCRDPNCFALVVEGDSMEPVLRAGDRVIAMPNSEPQTGDIVIARHRETHEVCVKLAHFFDGGRRVKLTSYNPAYPPLEFNRKDFRFIYPAYSSLRIFRRSTNGGALTK